MRMETEVARLWRKPVKEFLQRSEVCLPDWSKRDRSSVAKAYLAERRSFCPDRGACNCLDRLRHAVY